MMVRAIGKLGRVGRGDPVHEKLRGESETQENMTTELGKEIKTSLLCWLVIPIWFAVSKTKWHSQAKLL